MCMKREQSLSDRLGIALLIIGLSFSLAGEIGLGLFEICLKRTRVNREK